MLGNKIKTMRIQKQLSQSELAKRLSVSPQTVSKWENHISSPDISMLPLIARNFEISIDKLFDYQHEPLNYKERFVQYMYDNGMLRLGSFTLKSGRNSPYLIHSGYCNKSSQIANLGSFYAECLYEHGLESCCLIGLSSRDYTLVVATAMSLHQKFGVDSIFCTGSDLIAENISGHDWALLTDTFTSGKTLLDQLDQLCCRFQKAPVNIVVGFDRMETSGDLLMSAKHKIEASFKTRIYAIATFEDLLRAVEKNVISDQSFLRELYEYKKKYVRTV